MQIGLDKNTKLAAVFERYVEFCNERAAPPLKRVHLADLEFVHSQILNGKDIPEAAALMKNDRITVRADQSAERQADAVFARIQRDSDKAYFQQLRSLVLAPPCADVVLDCQGATYDDMGRVQRVLSTAVRCHSVIVAKRCPWLGRFILAARQEQARRSIVSVAETELSDEDDGQREEERNHGSKSSVVKESEDDDDNIRVLPFNNNNAPAAAAAAGAAQIEIDEDEQDRCGEADEASLAPESSLLRVVLPDYSRDAVRILLEYCYTNRVLALGHEAFLQACKTKPGRDIKSGEAVAPPYPLTVDPLHWPNGGQPNVSFRTALAVVSLAEDASMPRLSLMAEVAAAQTVSNSNVVEALSICETQKLATGNPLERLRKAAMDLVLRPGSRGVYALPTFRRALQDKSFALVPTLLTGTADAMQGIEQKNKKKSKSSSHHPQNNKRDWKSMMTDYFVDNDYADAYAREQERHKRRVERLKRTVGEALAEKQAKKLFEKPRKKDDAKRRSLKRMSHHLSGRLGNRVMARRHHRRGSR